MRVLNRNRVTEIPVSKEYIDSEYITWEYRAYVQVNSSYEVLGSRIEYLEGFDFEGNPIKTQDHLTKNTLEGIKAHAERLALERAESVDFESEAERE